MSDELTFDGLVGAIEEVHQQLSRQARLAVNTSLTLRNWFIGFTIDRYSLQGADRAQYGEGVVEAIADALTAKRLARCDRGALYRYRSFYQAYPGIVATPSPQSLERGESALEDALLSKLQGLLLELGHGFCFEARQKRVLIGETYNFVDLVFYHRILKCHVLVELKVGAFSHEHIGQLNTYVSWYAAHEMSEGDNPPIGLLLCTEKDHTVVKYALAGMSNQLFVSRYKVALPSEAEILGMLGEVVV